MERKHEHYIYIFMRGRDKTKRSVNCKCRERIKRKTAARTLSPVKVHLTVTPPCRCLSSSVGSVLAHLHSVFEHQPPTDDVADGRDSRTAPSTARTPPE